MSKNLKMLISRINTYHAPTNKMAAHHEVVEGAYRYGKYQILQLDDIQSLLQYDLP